MRTMIWIAWLGLASPVLAQTEKSFDAAAAFGARQSVNDFSLSPDGMSAAYIAPASGQGSILYTVKLGDNATPKPALQASGSPERLGKCEWVSNNRLVCIVYGVVKSSSSLELMPFTRLIAVDADGSNFKLLSTKVTAYTRGYLLGGGQVIDALPDQDGVVLMTRVYLPNDHLGSRIGSTTEGLGVDLVDTKTGSVETVEPPRPGVARYITDGHGQVRIMAVDEIHTSIGDMGITHYLYRLAGSKEWRKLGDYDVAQRSGFRPYVVDPTLNVAYGSRRQDGRLAIYKVSLDETLHEELVYARPDVDVDGLIRIGRRQRTVGVSYVAEGSTPVYFDTDVDKVVLALHKALPALPQLGITDSSVDESRLLVFAASDTNPGVFYLFDRKARRLETLLPVRRELDGVPLAAVKPISYPAADGTLIPAYLTLPPGQENAKGLPAIVLPHGGPEARDEWGFSWLPQYFASRGFAVLQPNFRGSSGYGDAWFEQNGFRSWPIAIGDVLDAGRWLVSQGIADPAKLGIVGWSYGGYAALQSATVDPKVFKAVVAIAPVTDLQALKEERRHWSDFTLVSNYIGDGPHVRDGSPLENAAKIKVPVLLFHGAMDRNVGILQSKQMAARLSAAGAKCELVTWDNLDHQLDDSEARAQMLRKSDAFLRQAMGM
jgi:dipeptidyl aminopeptidase/acylaminoacyl peptidase